MKLEECNTVKKCLLWAEERFPGFWDYANCKRLSDEELANLVLDLEGNKDYEKLLKHLEYVVTIDRTEEALRLLKSGARSFKFLERDNDTRGV